MAQPNGKIIANYQDYLITQFSGTLEYFTISLHQGSLLSVDVESFNNLTSANELGHQTGDTWVQVYLSSLRPTPGAGGAAYEWFKLGSLLCQGYCFYMVPLSWMVGQGRFDDPFSGRGKVTYYNEAGVPVAAGGTYPITVPGNEAWIVEAVQIQMTTSANVANRRLGCALISASAITTERLESQQTQAAGLTKNYFFSLGKTSYMGVNIHEPFLERFMFPGDAWVFLVDSVQAGDTFPAISYRYRRYIHH